MSFFHHKPTGYCSLCQPFRNLARSDLEDLDGEALKAEVDKLADDASGARARNSSTIMNVKGCIYIYVHIYTYIYVYICTYIHSVYTYVYIERESLID